MYASFNNITRYTYSQMYRLNCTLPVPPGGTTIPGLSVAGNVNTTVHFEADLRGGEPQVELLAYAYTASSQPYTYQLYAVVEALGPAQGSTAGEGGGEGGTRLRRWDRLRARQQVRGGGGGRLI